MCINEIHSDINFHKSLEFLHLSNYQSAMESIDLAITSNNYTSFYMFQKIKILFVAQKLSECSNYIIENLKYFYDHSSLSIFSKTLYYYQSCLGCSITSIEDLLLVHNIPAILAQEFPSFMDDTNIDLLKKITYTKECGEYLACIDYCDLVLSKDSSNLTAQLIKARCYCLLGDHYLGIYTYKQILNLKPNVSSIYAELGTVLFDLKYYPRSISYFKKALKLDPSNAYLLTQLAEGFYCWKEYDSALTYFKKALSINPDCNETLLRIATIYEQINKRRKAKKYYKKISDITKMPSIYNTID